MSTRINKYIAERLGVSRREADDLIRDGRVQIDQQPATIGSRVGEQQVVTVDGQAVDGEANYVYLAFHKPAGYVCSRRAQGDVPTIYDILSERYHPLKTVGRLDKDSSGLILLTNDGDFTQRMTHPSHKKRKVYEVELDASLQPLHRQMISDYGVMLDDGRSRFELERLGTGDGHTDSHTDTEWRIIMSEGRNRQIRRTFAALGYTVVALHRTDFGPYHLNQLAAGEYEEISI